MARTDQEKKRGLGKETKQWEGRSLEKLLALRILLFKSWPPLDKVLSERISLSKSWLRRFRERNRQIRRKRGDLETSTVWKAEMENKIGLQPSPSSLSSRKSKSESENE